MYTKCLYKLDISVWFGLFTTPAQLSKFSMFILWVKHEIQKLTYQPDSSVET